MIGTRRLSLALTLASTLLASEKAQAQNGTLLLFEGSVGASAGRASEPETGLLTGVAFGATVRPRGSRLRWHLLGNLQSTLQGYGSDRRRTDIDVFFSQRTVLPVLFPLRLYAETGLGVRSGLTSVVGAGEVWSFEPLVVLALGAQLRWTRELSVGVRGAFEPLDPVRTPLDPEPVGRRGTLTLTLGAHF